MIGDTLQYRVLSVGWLVFKVQARHEVVEQPTGKHGDADVRSLPSLSIEWNGTWLDRLEPVASVLCCTGAAKSQEGWVQRCWPLIPFVEVTAGGIDLPDLQESVRHWSSTVVEHAADHDDALANRLATS